MKSYHYSNQRSLLPCVFMALLLAAPFAPAADWQYAVPFSAGKSREGVEKTGLVRLWIPPEAGEIRGLLVGGKLKIEGEIVLSPEVRRVCAEQSLGIVYFDPHINGLFDFWKEGNTDRERWLQAFADLAKRSGRPEIARVPWITMGHSTAGIFCRNVAYAFPGRVAGIIHIKSGNFHEKQHLPPEGSLVGVPMLIINGQFETFGPSTGIRPELGRETQWQAVREDIVQFRTSDPDYLMSTWLDLGGDHFYGSRALDKIAALFLAKTGKYRIPANLPPGGGPVMALPLKASDGWLSDIEIYSPKFAPAAWADYQGDKAKAYWHYDEEMAKALVEHHRGGDRHQALANPTLTWIEEGDGWSFRASSAFLDTMPEAFGGAVGNTKVGHASTPITYHARPGEPVEQTGPDTFRVLYLARDVKEIAIAAVNVGDDNFRPTNRWEKLAMPVGKNDKSQGAPQTITFPAIPNLPSNAAPLELQAKASSGLPMHYRVDYGPVVVRDGKLTVSEIPAQAAYPLDCKITAFQIGRRINPEVKPADPVSLEFQILKP